MDNWEKWLFYGILILSGASSLFAIASYFKYYFHIEEDELIVNKGIFQKKKTSIPFERIQTVNLEQNIFHQILNVYKVVVDTAGSSKEEFVFDALKKEEAEALRTYILEKKEEQFSGHYDEIRDQPTFGNEKVILTIGLSKLLKIGITENHFKSFGLILAFGYWIYENLSEIGFDLVDNYGNEIKDKSTLGFVVFWGVFFFIISFGVSLIRTVLTHFNLTFGRTQNGFIVRQGLLTKSNVSALDQKIQMLVFSDSILKKLLGYKDMFFKQASSIEVQNKKSIKIPGCTEYHIGLVTNELYNNENLDNLIYFPVEKDYLYRVWMYEFLATIILVSIGIILKQPVTIFLVTSVGLYLMSAMYFHYKKTRYGFNHEMIRINGGTFGDKATILPIHKIQAVKLRQSPYQHRKNLATIVLYTASGGTAIPYVKLDLAQKIADYFLYRIEKDRRKWM